MLFSLIFIAEHDHGGASIKNDSKVTTKET